MGRSPQGPKNVANVGFRVLMEDDDDELEVAYIRTVKDERNVT